MNHIHDNAGTIALLSAAQEALELNDRLRERLGQPTPHKGKPILIRLRDMEEYDRAEVCAVLSALARGFWDWEDNSETMDFDERVAPPSLPIHLIAAQLGHSNIGTTSRYIDHIAPGAVVAAVREVAWS